MKVTVNDKEKTVKIYPWIGISDNGTIVLFNSKNHGICLTGYKNEPTNYGKYKDDWCEYMFDTFTGEIVLSND